MGLVLDYYALMSRGYYEMKICFLLILRTHFDLLGNEVIPKHIRSPPHSNDFTMLSLKTNLHFEPQTRALTHTQTRHLQTYSPSHRCLGLIEVLSG